MKFNYLSQKVWLKLTETYLDFAYYLEQSIRYKIIIFLFPLHTLIFLIALLINYQFMPHPEPDDKCEKKYWLKVLALNQNHFGKKKIDIFLLLLKNPNDFFYLCS